MARDFRPRAPSGLWHLICLATLVPLEATAQQPLDVFDPTPREVFVELETSTDLSVVGASFSTPVPATYSAVGNTGTLAIPVESHETMRSGFLTPIPGSFTPIVIEIDLVSLAATSQSASGSLQSGPIFMGFVQNPLGSDSLAGFITGGDIFTPFFCTSQAEVDAACAMVPAFCNSTCVLVPGSAYEPATGLVNLVGSEEQQGCDGAICSGPFLLFSERGDLRLSEPLVQGLPALDGAGAALLVASLLAAAGCTLRRPTAAARPSPSSLPPPAA